LRQGKIKPGKGDRLDKSAGTDWKMPGVHGKHVYKYSTQKDFKEELEKKVRSNNEAEVLQVIRDTEPGILKAAWSNHSFENLINKLETNFEEALSEWCLSAE
jgi:hypothetical protein